MSRLGDFVRAARQAAGMTQEDLSEAIDRSLGYVGMLETGKVDRPKTATLRALARALGVPLQDLLVATGQLDQPLDEDISAILQRVAAIQDEDARWEAWNRLPDPVRQALYRHAEDLALRLRRLAQAGIEQNGGRRQ